MIIVCAVLPDMNLVDVLLYVEKFEPCIAGSPLL